MKNNENMNTKENGIPATHALQHTSRLTFVAKRITNLEANIAKHLPANRARNFLSQRKNSSTEN